MRGKTSYRARRSKMLQMVFKFEIGRKFESSEFGRRGIVRKGEMSASLNFDGKVARGKIGLPGVK